MEKIADGIEIWCADFMDVPLESVNHIITDPPYEQRSHDAIGRIRRNDGAKKATPIDFDGIDKMRNDVAWMAKQVCDGWFLAFCTTEGVALWRDAIELHKLKYKTPMIWVKPDAMPKFNGQGPSHGHECIVTAWCSPGYSRWNGGGRRGILTHYCNPKSRDGRHRTEKPLSLMCELILLFTNPGDTILDPFMGSGSTGVACLRLGRKFIGIEINEEYYAIAKDRLTKAAAQPDMFVNEYRKPVQGKML